MSEDGALRPEPRGQPWRNHLFNTLEVLQSRGWDINQLVRHNLPQPILMMVLASGKKVRWCLAHGADPNAHFKSLYRNLPTFAGGCARIPILRLLRDHGADFRQSDALHRCAERNNRVEALRWLLDEAGV